MQPLVIALDVDGVLVEVGLNDNWIDIIGGEFGLTMLDLEPFFQNHWEPVVTGRRAVEEALAEHRPEAVTAMRAATRWTRGQTLAELVFQYASPAVQREIGQRLTALSASRASGGRARETAS